MSDVPLIPSAFDTETFMPPPGCLTPKLVCASWKEPGWPVAKMGTREAALERAYEILSDPTRVLVAANAPFDLGVLCAELPDVFVPLVFKALEEARVSDTHIREALGDIYEGRLFRHRNTNAPIGRYSVEYLAEIYLGLDLSREKKDPRSWRKRFGELDGLPLEAYPPDAVAYSLGDAEHELDIWLNQRGLSNLHDEPAQMRAAWCLHLMAIWGIRTDPIAVNKLANEIEEKYQSNRIDFLKAGILKVVTCKRHRQEDGSYKEDLPDAITEETLAHAPPLAAWLPTARRALAAGKKLRFGEDSKTLEALTVAAYKGAAPTTPKGSVKTDRDTLSESGSDLLDEYGGSTNIAKLRGTYVPVLKQGTRVPINAKFNVLVETGRTSCGEPNLQNLPRKGGIRECFVPRTLVTELEVPDDYVLQPGEEWVE